MPDQPAPAEPAAEVCTDPWTPLPPGEWSEPERWAWEQIRTGRPANFNQRYGEDLDPRDEALWTEQEKERRQLRADFLRTVLLARPWRKRITHVGVQIIGACFTEPVNLTFAEVGYLLGLMRSRLTAGLFCLTTCFKYSLGLQGSACQAPLALDGADIKGGLFMGQGRFQEVRLPGAQVGGSLDMTGAALEGQLAMDGAEIRGDLFMQQGRFQEVRLHGVQVGGSLDMTGAAFEGQLAMDGAGIKGDLFMDKGQFQEVRLHGVRVGGQLSMNGAAFEGELAMDGAGIKGSLFMDKGRFQEVRLHGAQVGGQLSMNGAAFEGQLAMDGAGIKGDLFMRQGRFQEVRLHGAQVGGLIDMEGAAFEGKLNTERLALKDDLDLRRAKFQGTANLRSADIGGHILCEGAEFKSLNLSDTRVDGFYDGKVEGSEAEAWPEALNLDRFVYNHIRGSGDQTKTVDLTDRPASWFKAWLAKHQPYSPQPYQQCAKVLRQAGQPWKAAEVLYAAKERERKEARKNKETARWLWLSFLKGAIGYGQTKRFVIFPALWALVLLGVGFGVFWLIPSASNYSWWWALGYSLNHLLPIVTLHPGFAKLHPLGLVPGGWFIFQTLCGWALALLIAAGLAGVGKPGGRT